MDVDMEVVIFIDMDMEMGMDMVVEMDTDTDLYMDMNKSERKFVDIGYKISSMLGEFDIGIDLTLIREAVAVYDFRNFKEVYLCNGLSSEFQNSCIPRKTSSEYILLSTYERKMAF
jgi:hypothetical protein